MVVGTPPGGKTVPGGWISTLYIELAHRMLLGRGLEPADALARLAPEDAVVVGIARQRLDPDQLAAEPEVIIDGQVVPVRQADVRGRRRVVAERDLGLIDGPQHRAGDRPAAGVEHLDDRIDRRAQPAPEDLDDDRLSLPGPEPVEVDVPVVADATGDAAGDRQLLGLRGARRWFRARRPGGPSATTTFRVAAGCRPFPPERTTGTPTIVPGSTPDATGNGTSRTPPRFEPATSIRAVVPRSTPIGKTDRTNGIAPAAIR